jgi:hypothetical protein
MRPPLKFTSLTLLAAVWIAGMAYGFRVLARYEFTSGPSVSDAGQFWPAAAPPLASTAPTLVLFLHPECPCSQATVSSLSHILAHANGPLLTYIFAVLPDGAPAAWAHTLLLEQAAQLPGVQVIPDPHARLAHQFGAFTSGHMALYDHLGHCLFAGGITPERGHEGDNPGTEAIEDILLDRIPKISKTPVFGCALYSPNSPVLDPQ